MNGDMFLTLVERTEMKQSFEENDSFKILQSVFKNQSFRNIHERSPWGLELVPLYHGLSPRLTRKELILVHKVC